MKFRLLALLLLAFLPTTGWAVSPHMIADGEQLFTRNWESHAPTLDGDGLGPLYNASSCASCHQQGGIGGGGAAAFNAHSIGIDAIEVYGRRLDNTMLGNLISQFHPGFVQSDRSVITFMPLLHHGGSKAHQQFHDFMTHAAAAELSDTGGPSGPAEVRTVNRLPILFDHTVDGFRIRISATFTAATRPPYSAADWLIKSPARSSIGRCDYRSAMRKSVVDRRHSKMGGMANSAGAPMSPRCWSSATRPAPTSWGYRRGG